MTGVQTCALPIYIPLPIIIARLVFSLPFRITSFFIQYSYFTIRQTPPTNTGLFLPSFPFRTDNSPIPSSPITYPLLGYWYGETQATSLSLPPLSPSYIPPLSSPITPYIVPFYTLYTLSIYTLFISISTHIPILFLIYISHFYHTYSNSFFSYTFHIFILSLCLYKKNIEE